MEDGVRLKLEHVYIDSDATIAGLLSQAATAENATFDNRCRCICRIGGGTIVHVRAGPDSAIVDYTVLRDERP